MEYLYYVMVVLFVLALCAMLFRRRADTPERLHYAAAEPAIDNGQRHRVLHREMRKVPTPWGWPGGQTRSGRVVGGIATSQAADGTATTLQTWVDRLVAEKRTKEDGEYLLRKDASLRALIEDRYGRKVVASEMAYRKVRPPVLQEPGRLHDQMDNFPSGRTDRIVSGLQRESSATQPPAELGAIKTPWGW